ncbi:MAG: ribosome biogenesis GTPase Der [Actinobacteria bacterium]|nr:ribosome biogenesis GTPase Der [Actinomycetota bacterium]
MPDDGRDEIGGQPDTEDDASFDSIELAAGDAFADFDDDDDPEALLARFSVEADAPDAETDDQPSRSESAGRPVVAVVGRPNVGKSSLVNRILGGRAAVVEDVPGVTRDRVSYDAEWAGREFELVDTGGWDPKVTGMAASVAAQAERAMHEADVVVLVVDATVGATDTEDAVVKVLRRAGVPVLLVANKCDDARTELDAAALWSLGLGEPLPVSALHGRGSGDFLDALIAVMPTNGRGAATPDGPRRVALLGKPNVGKSSLLNRLAGTERVVVDSVAGTTVDPVDELVTLGGKQWVFIDTAGIRRRAKEASGHEYYATLRTRGALARSEVAVVLIDASEPVTEQDVRLVSMVVESGRALVIALNKWDLVDDERRRYLEREYDREFGQVPWARRINLSAATGRHVDRLVPALEQALNSWGRRVSTGRLNTFLRELRDEHPHPIRGGKQPRIMFATQAAVRPPTFVLFTTGFLEAGYRRFIERRIREEFAFTGTPIVINLRIREKRKRR